MDRAATAPRETGSGGAEGRSTHASAPASAGDAATAGAAPPAAAIGSPTPERCASPHALPHPHAASNHALGGNDANHIRDLISREPPVNLLGDPRGDGDDDGDDDDDDVDASGSTMEPPRKRAAVLVPLFRRACDGRLSVLLTRRSLKLRHHPGEVAFAGKGAGPFNPVFIMMSDLVEFQTLMDALIITLHNTHPHPQAASEMRMTRAMWLRHCARRTRRWGYPRSACMCWARWASGSPSMASA